MTSITEISKDIYPDDFDLALAQEKGIGTQAEYVKVQENYGMLLSTYLNGLYDFASADASLDAKGFQPIEDGDYYYNRSIPGSKYFYLRNNIHVERLAQEQIDYLKGSISNPADAKGIQIVKDTYKEVLAIRQDFAKGDEYLTSYSKRPLPLDELFSNTAMVFYVEYKNIQADNDEYWNNRRQEAVFVDEISKDIIDAFYPALNVDTIILNQSWQGTLD
jgi:hypothetical protein